MPFNAAIAGVATAALSTVMRLTFPFIQSRLAQPASPVWNVAKTLAQALFIWAIFLWIVPMLLFHLEGVMGLAHFRFMGIGPHIIGLALFIGYGAFGLTCGVLMAIKGQGTPLPLDCPRTLVVSGPYLYIRNPMAMASFTQGVGVALMIGSPLVMFYALAGYFFWNGVLRPWEEADLEKRFGEAYRHYRRHVRCWVPRRTAYVPDQE